MRWLIAIAICAVTMMPAWADGTTQLPGFTKLKDAFTFVDNELDKPHSKPFEDFLHLGIDAESLKISRGKKRLVADVQNKEFPPTDTVYGVELLNGQVYAQFSKRGSKWYFGEIRGNK